MARKSHADFVAEQSQSASAASSLVSSWRRSLVKYGLDPAETRLPGRATAAELSDRIAAMEWVVNLAAPQLDQLYDLVGLSGCNVLLTDARGLVLAQRVRDGDAITGVRTSLGDIATETVICCTGAWSRSLGEMVGVDLPVDPVRRELLVTEPIPDLPAEIPFTIDFSTSLYFHREGPGLLVGLSNRDEEPGWSLEPTDEWLEQVIEAAERRIPLLEEVGMASRWAGFYEVTPDHNALIGEAQGVSRFLYATGFSGHGFLQGPAVGQVMAELYRGETPSVDVSAMDASRFAGAGLRPEMNIV